MQYIDLVERIAAHLDAQGDVAGLAELAYLRGRLEGGAETRRTVLAAWPGAGSTEAMRAALPRIRAAVRACA